MYGLPDSMVVGVAKRMSSNGRVVITREKAQERAEIDDATMQAVVLAPFTLAGGVLDGIAKFANFIGKRADRFDRKMRAKRARAKLAEKKKV
jgi:hypothetical protein